MIAGAVQPLMMAKHEGRNELSLTAHRKQRPLAVIGMKPRRICLALGERAGPHPNRNGYRKLANVMNIGRPPDGANVRGRNPEPLPGGLRKSGHGARMTERVG